MESTTMIPSDAAGPGPTAPARGAARDERRMERALAWLAEHYAEQPGLADAAAAVGLSEFHFQRLFSRWAGISPKKYVGYLTLQHAKRVLDESRSVLDATYASGLSSPGRLHDLFVTVDALSPGEYKRRGEGLRVRYGFHPSPFGECLVMATERGVCGLAFTAARGREAALGELSRGWERAAIESAPRATAPLAERAFAARGRGGADLALVLRGTAFQIKVWEALLAIPPGRLTTYSDLAARVAHPGAARAVASAVGANPIAWLIPCHRVIRNTGLLGGYRWGIGPKLAALSREHAAA